MIRLPESGPEDRPALSRLIPLDPEVFANEYWGRKPLFTAQAESSAGFADLFSADAVDEIVADRAIRTPFVRMANEGTVLASSRFTSGGGFGAEIADQVDSEKVLTEFADGATLVLQGLHRTWPALADFTRQLVRDLSSQCQVNSYITPASSRGFDPHYDVHDVFVIQIFGEKSWTIHEPVHTDPLSDEPWTQHRDAVSARASGVPYLARTFVPGDVLYLPRGWIHSATALGGTSIHLTIGVSAFTRFDVLERLVGQASTSERMRASLPLGFASAGPDALDEVTREILADFAETLGAGSAAGAVASSLARTLERRTAPEPVRPLATTEVLLALTAQTAVRLRGGLSPRLSWDADTVSLELPTKTVRMPGEASAAIEALSAGHVIAAGELPGLDPASSLVVARRLLKEGVLVIA